MTLSLSDLVFYACANRPNDDESMGGGAIDLKTKILTTTVFEDQISLVSSSSSDGSTKYVLIIGRARNGYLYTETLFLNGTTVVRGRIHWDTILDIQLSADPVGTITIKQYEADTTFVTISAGKRGWTSLFKNAYPYESNLYTRYDKLFIKNESGSDDLMDPATFVTNSELSVGPALAVNDTVTIADRLTAPSGITFSAANEIADLVTLAHGEAHGIWLKQVLLPGTRIGELNLSVVGA